MLNFEYFSWRRGYGSIERLVLSVVVGAASRREVSRDAQYKF
ncbi:MAG: hypothetical protein V7K77_18540 [Nostoc sp.]